MAHRSESRAIFESSQPPMQRSYLEPGQYFEKQNVSTPALNDIYAKALHHTEADNLRALSAAATYLARRL